MKKPDGGILYSQFISFSSSQTFMDSTTLPASGAYTILVDPSNQYTGSITLTLYDTTDDLTGTLTIGGASLAVSISIPGQNAAITFAGAAGQRVGITITAPPFGNAPTLKVKKPDGSIFLSTSVYSSGLYETDPLPVSGTYTLVIDPYGNYTGSMTIALADITDAPGAIAIGGSSVTVTTTIAGQNARLTFSGTASQQVTAHITSNTIGIVTVKLLKPDGTTLATLQSSGASFNLATQTLPVTGTYMVLVDPYQTNTGSLIVNLTSP